MKVLNVLFSECDWNPGPSALATSILHGACGFFYVSEDNVNDCDLLRIWSLPGTNPFEKTIVYTAPIIDWHRTKWNGQWRTVIQFNTNKSEWDDTESLTRPACNRSGWVITEE